MRTPQRRKQDGPPGRNRGRKPRHRKGGAAQARLPAEHAAPRGGTLWLYGRHAVAAALGNPDRVIHRIIFSSEPIEFKREKYPQPETMTRDDLDDLLPPGAVHQGCAALVDPLPARAIEDVCALAASAPSAIVVALDQVSDPQNVGAILRSAAVFGARAVIVQDRHAPEVTGALAKAASGAVEHVPLVRVTNLTRALESLKEAGFWCLGLDSAATATIDEAPATAHRVLTLGAEGPGLRRLTRESCDLLVRVDGASGAIGSLNVSNAAAVALYALSRNPG